MRPATRGGRLQWLVLVGLGLACERDTHSRLDPMTAPLASTGSAAPSAASAPPAETPRPDERSVSRPFVPEREPEAAPTLPNAAEATDVTESQGGVVGPFVVDSLVDVGAAGPATASSAGVAMVNRRNELWLARLTKPLERGTSPEETPIAGLPESAGPSPLGHGPAVRRGIAYWISRGRLLRQRLSSAGAGSVPEALVDDARVGTRPAIPVGPSRYTEALPDVVAYIVKARDADAPLTASLWIAGRAATLPLTDDTTAAHSVALAGTSQGLAALFLEARTGMSTLHLRRVDFAKKGEPSLGEDRVVWVGGPSRSSTEFFAQGEGDASLAGFMTLEQDATHFGLVQFQLGVEDGPATEPAWLLYPNGIEPAPVASENVCGRPMLALARPTSAVPHAPQELVLIDRAKPSESVVVARSKAFFDVSLAAFGRGALIAYVADHRTWARSVRCVGP